MRLKRYIHCENCDGKIELDSLTDEYDGIHYNGKWYCKECYKRKFGYEDDAKGENEEY